MNHAPNLLLFNPNLLSDKLRAEVLVAASAESFEMSDPSYFRYGDS